MPRTSSAKKAQKVSARKHVFNLRRTRAMRRAVKDVRTVLAEGKEADAKTLLRMAYKTIDKAAKRGVIKKNTAARKKSRLTRVVQKTKTV